MNSIVAKDLKKMFGKTPAVDNVSFAVKKGEIFGFLGPNGAGKTTTIRMLTGVISPDSGMVEIEGISLRENMAEAKMKFGVIPEIGNVYVDLTAKQNLYLTGKFYGLKGKFIEEKAEKLLRALNLYERRDYPARTFSKGMKQRLSIACAIMHDPDILFLDEPTEGLDVQSKRMVVSIINELKSKGSTIFLTTHNIEEANRLCETVCIINRGKIAAIGRPETLKKTFDDTQSIEISFRENVPSEMLEFDGISSVDLVGDKYKLYTSDPDMAVKKLASFAENHSYRISSLEICGPSLEEAFVILTGDSR